MTKNLILITDKVCDYSGYLSDAQYYEFMNIARGEFIKENNINNLLKYNEFKLVIHKHIKLGDEIFVVVEKSETDNKIIFREVIYDQSNNLMATGDSIFSYKA